MKMLTRVLSMVVLTLMAPAVSRAVVLYDASLGTTPSSQGWVLGAIPSAPTETVAANVLSFESSLPGYAGYVRLSPDALDADSGFRLAFELRIRSSTAINVNRAPFSLTTISSDASRAIEIGIDAASVFSQDDTPLFVRGESAALDTMSDFVFYELLVHGSTYELLANSAIILSGTLRDYGPFMGLIDPYETPNLLFFGDNTTSAGGAWQLTTIELTELPSSDVPEPGSLSLLLVAGAIALARRRS